ncbi:MAG: ABC transporter substrate-binding protein [Candidatus Aminicenantes bacterium]|nr:ABC transporter substrate-binding protein [Candidatus Aminicenantes bacterium]
MKSRDSAIKAVLKKSGDSYTEAQREKLIVLINDIMDFSAMSQTALGAYWEELNENQKNEFVSDFSNLVKRSSVKKLNIFQAVIEYKQVLLDGEKARVFTQATYERTRTNVDYELHRKNGRWLVTDFSIDDVSTAISYQKSFQRIMRKHGFSGLMERLKQKLADEGG